MKKGNNQVKESKHSLEKTEKESNRVNSSDLLISDSTKVGDIFSNNFTESDFRNKKEHLDERENNSKWKSVKSSTSPIIYRKKQNFQKNTKTDLFSKSQSINRIRSSENCKNSNIRRGYNLNRGINSEFSKPQSPRTDKSDKINKNIKDSPFQGNSDSLIIRREYETMTKHTIDISLMKFLIMSPTQQKKLPNYAELYENLLTTQISCFKNALLSQNILNNVLFHCGNPKPFNFKYNESESEQDDESSHNKKISLDNDQESQSIKQDKKSQSIKHDPESRSLENDPNFIKYFVSLLMKNCQVNELSFKVFGPPLSGKTSIIYELAITSYEHLQQFGMVNSFLMFPFNFKKNEIILSDCKLLLKEIIILTFNYISFSNFVYYEVSDQLMKYFLHLVSNISQEPNPSNFIFYNDEKLITLESSLIKSITHEYFSFLHSSLSSNPSLFIPFIFQFPSKIGTILDFQSVFFIFDHTEILEKYSIVLHCSSKSFLQNQNQNKPSLGPTLQTTLLRKDPSKPIKCFSRKEKIMSLHSKGIIEIGDKFVINVNEMTADSFKDGMLIDTKGFITPYIEKEVIVNHKTNSIKTNHDEKVISTNSTILSERNPNPISNNFSLEILNFYIKIRVGDLPFYYFCEDDIVNAKRMKESGLIITINDCMGCPGYIILFHEILLLSKKKTKENKLWQNMKNKTIDSTRDSILRKKVLSFCNILFQGGTQKIDELILNAITSSSDLIISFGFQSS